MSDWLTANAQHPVFDTWVEQTQARKTLAAERQSHFSAPAERRACWRRISVIFFLAWIIQARCASFEVAHFWPGGLLQP